MNATTPTHPPSNQVPYFRLGGDAAVKQLADAFYEAMDRRPDAAGIRALHGSDLAPIKQRLYEFLSGWLGGPPLAQLQQRHVCMFSAHAPFSIGASERDAWMACMDEALTQTVAEPELAQLLHEAFYRMADGLARAAPH